MVISAISNSYAKITRGYNFPSQWFWKIHVKYLGKIEFAELISNPEKKASPSLKFWGLVSFTALSMRKISTSFERILNFSSKPVNGLLMVYWWSTDGLLMVYCSRMLWNWLLYQYTHVYIYPRKMTPQNTSTGWRFRQPGDHIWLISPPQKNRAWPSSRRVVDPTSGCESSERAGQKPPKGFKTMRFINWAEPPKKKR